MWNSCESRITQLISFRYFIELPCCEFAQIFTCLIYIWLLLLMLLLFRVLPLFIPTNVCFFSFCLFFSSFSSFLFHSLPNFVGLPNFNTPQQNDAYKFSVTNALHQSHPTNPCIYTICNANKSPSNQNK